MATSTMLSVQRVILPVLRQRIATCSVIWRVPAQGYAKGIGKGVKGTVIKKKEYVVEEDPEKLCKYLCGGNIRKEGTDPELKPDSEYPDWLWSLSTTKPEPLKPRSEDEMKNLNEKEWNRLRKHTIKRNNKLQSLKKF